MHTTPRRWYVHGLHLESSGVQKPAAGTECAASCGGGGCGCATRSCCFPTLSRAAIAIVATTVTVPSIGTWLPLRLLLLLRLQLRVLALPLLLHRKIAAHLPEAAPAKLAHRRHAPRLVHGEVVEGVRLAAKPRVQHVPIHRARFAVGCPRHAGGHAFGGVRQDAGELGRALVGRLAFRRISDCFSGQRRRVAGRIALPAAPFATGLHKPFGLKAVKCLVDSLLHVCGCKGQAKFRQCPLATARRRVLPLRLVSLTWGGVECRENDDLQAAE
jgi:hypothetical protein